jgi:DNA-binding winged helix-turn-helix (wHTH) protein
MVRVPLKNPWARLKRSQFLESAMNAPLPRVLHAFGDFQLDPMRLRLQGSDGRPVQLTARVFETLLYFVEHSGEVLDKSTMMHAIWPKVVVEEGSLTLCQSSGE